MKRGYWDVLMDGDHNALRQLPPSVRYQFMTLLAMMWSFVFCAMLGWWLWFPWWAAGHVLLLGVGALLTEWTFAGAYRQSHRDLYRTSDGRSAHHDDLWGG
jgi:hypothetical protein